MPLRTIRYAICVAFFLPVAIACLYLAFIGENIVGGVVGCLISVSFIIWLPKQIAKEIEDANRTQ